MKTLLVAALLVAVSARGSFAPAPRVPVLVELFTSEACSSCPPADALLESLQRDQAVDGVEVIPIGLHVDYFNHLGWKDAFSSASYTARQQDYSQIFGADSVYTPQIVVDGRAAVAGTAAELVRQAIESSAGRAHLALHVTARAATDRVRVTIELPAAPANTEKIQLMAAITEDGLTSMVKSGENHGRALHHVAVARKVQRLETLSGGASIVERQLQLERAWGPGGLKAVVWLQGVKSRQVYGAAVAAITR